MPIKELCCILKLATRLALVDMVHDNPINNIDPKGNSGFLQGLGLSQRSRKARGVAPFSTN